MVDKQIEDAAAPLSRRRLRRGHASPKSVGQALGVELTARDIKGASFEDAQEIAKSKAERQLTETIRQAIEENLPPDAEQLGMDLAGAGKLGQQPVRAQSQGKRPAENRGHRRRRASLGPRRPRGIPQRASRRVDPEASTFPGERVPPAGLGKTNARRLGPSQVHAGDRSGRAGPSSIGPRSSAGSGPRPASSTPTRKPSCRLRIALRRYLGDRSQIPDPAVRPGRPGRLGQRALSNPRSMPKSCAPCSRSQIEARLIELAHEPYQGAKLAEELDAKLAAARIAARTPTPIQSARTPAAARAELADWAQSTHSGSRSRPNLSDR